MGRNAAIDAVRNGPEWKTNISMPESIGKLVNVSQTRLPFRAIPSERSREYFLHEPPDDHPVDTQ